MLKLCIHPLIHNYKLNQKVPKFVTLLAFQCHNFVTWVQYFLKKKTLQNPFKRWRGELIDRIGQQTGSTVPGEMHWWKFMVEWGTKQGRSARHKHESEAPGNWATYSLKEFIVSNSFKELIHPLTVIIEEIEYLITFDSWCVIVFCWYPLLFDILLVCISFKHSQVIKYCAHSLFQAAI